MHLHTCVVHVHLKEFIRNQVYFTEFYEELLFKNNKLYYIQYVCNHLNQLAIVQVVDLGYRKNPQQPCLMYLFSANIP